MSSESIGRSPLSAELIKKVAVFGLGVLALAGTTKPAVAEKMSQASEPVVCEQEPPKTKKNKLPNGWTKPLIKRSARTWLIEASNKPDKDGKRTGVNFLESENGDQASVLLRDVMPDRQAQIESIKQGNADRAYMLCGAFIFQDAKDNFFITQNPQVWGFRFDFVGQDGESGQFFNGPDVGDPIYDSLMLFYKDTDGVDQMIGSFPPHGVGIPTKPGTKLVGVLLPPENDGRLHVYGGQGSINSDGNLQIDTGDDLVVSETLKSFGTLAKAYEYGIRKVGEDGIPHSLYAITDFEIQR